MSFVLTFRDLFQIKTTGVKSQEKAWFLRLELNIGLPKEFINDKNTNYISSCPPWGPKFFWEVSGFYLCPAHSIWLRKLFSITSFGQIDAWPPVWLHCNRRKVIWRNSDVLKIFSTNDSIGLHCGVFLLSS